MEAFFLCLLSIILIDVCSARSSYSGSSGSSGSSSSSGGITAAIVVPIVVGIFLFVAILTCIIKKCNKKQGVGVIPVATQMALAQQENQYAPPGFKQGPYYNQPPAYGQMPAYNQAAPYGQVPAYNQPPPYGQVPAYNQPPPYSAPIEPTK